MKVIFIFCAFLFSATLYGFEGSYSLRGVDPYEEQLYSGRVDIVKDQNGVYQAHWIINDNETYLGTGLKTEDEIAFVFIGQKPKAHTPPLTGLQLYKIEGETLKGTWVLWNRALIGYETLEPIAKTQTLAPKSQDQ